MLQETGVGRRCATGLCWCVVVMGEEVEKEGWSGWGWSRRWASGDMMSGDRSERGSDSDFKSGELRAEVGGGSRSPSCRCNRDGSRGGGVSGGLGRAKAVGVLDSWVLVIAFEVGSGVMGTLLDDGMFVHGKTVGGGASTLSSLGIKEDA